MVGYATWLVLEHNINARREYIVTCREYIVTCKGKCIWKRRKDKYM